MSYEGKLLGQPMFQFISQVCQRLLVRQVSSLVESSQKPGSCKFKHRMFFRHFLYFNVLYSQLLNRDSHSQFQQWMSYQCELPFYLINLWTHLLNTIFSGRMETEITSQILQSKLSHTRGHCHHQESGEWIECLLQAISGIISSNHHQSRIHIPSALT